MFSSISFVSPKESPNNLLITFIPLPVRPIAPSISFAILSSSFKESTIFLALDSCSNKSFATLPSANPLSLVKPEAAASALLRSFWTSLVSLVYFKPSSPDDACSAANLAKVLDKLV